MNQDLRKYIYSPCRFESNKGQKDRVQCLICGAFLFNIKDRKNSLFRLEFIQIWLCPFSLLLYKQFESEKKLIFLYYFLSVYWWYFKVPKYIFVPLDERWGTHALFIHRVHVKLPQLWKWIEIQQWELKSNLLSLSQSQ